MFAQNQFIRKSVPFVSIVCMLVFPVQAQDVREVVAKVRSALGIDAFESQDQAVRLSGPLSLVGTDGTHTFIFDATGRFRHSHDTKLVSIDTAFDGKTMRTRNLGGEVCDEALGERTGSLVESWAATGLGFAKDRGKSFQIDNETSEDDTIVLRMDLDEGRGWTKVTVDRETWLPRQWTYGGATGSSTIHLDQYAKVGPLHVPKRIRTVTENGGETVTEVEQAELVHAPDWQAELAAIKSPDNVAFDANAKSKLEVKRAPTGHLLVHPTIAGKDIGWFIFDTGAGENVLDTRAVKDYEFKTFGNIPAVGVGGAIKATLCRPSSLKLGPLTMREPLAVVMDLAFLDPFMGVKIGGIIGYGTLARCVAEVDLTGAKISLHDPAAYRLRGGKWTPLIVYDGVPCVPGKFEDHEGFFRLDTGAGGHPVAFHAPTVRRKGLLDGRKTSHAQVGGVGGMKGARAGRVTSLEFGGKRHEDVSAVFAVESAGAFADSYIDANIGVALIGTSRIVLDYPNSRIAFKSKAKKSESHGGKVVPSHPAGK
jgi:hypothetical protein